MGKRRRAGLAAVLVVLATTAAQGEPASVIDGDTIQVGEKTYRIEGIDAPEHGQKCGSWPCGKEATAAMAGLVEGHELECLEHGQDDFGRTIATCNVGDIDIGRAMVLSGLAWAFTRYSDTYVEEQAEAKRRGVGVWSGVFQTPWEFREERWEVEAQVAPEGCPIKGNISSNGKIYHPPWSPWYTRTKISVEKGERWFCDEAEAVAAGWRAPQWR